MEVMISPHASPFAAAMLERNGSIFCSGSDAYAVGNLSLRRRIDKAAEHRNAALGALSRAGLGGLVSLLFRLRGYREVQPAALTLEMEFPFEVASAEPAKIGGLCEAAMGELNMAVIRDRRYLIWRYAEAPHCDQYRALALRQLDGTKTGLAMLQRRPGSSNIVICELLCDPSVPGVCEQMISAVLIAALRWGGTIIETRVVQNSIIDIWRRAGLTVSYKPYPQFWVSPKPHVSPPDSIRGMYAGGDHKLY